MTGPPLMRQTWRDLTFLHWPFDPAVVKPFLPAGLDLDLYGGQAWIGLVPFVIDDLTLPSAPAVPWLSSFAETNVRTYVVDKNGVPGVWFFSLDAARLPAVIGARAAYALPYFWAKMKVYCDGKTARYVSRRRFSAQGRVDIEVLIGDAIAEPGGLEMFLTARYRLYAYRRKRILKADVQHPPWKLQRASALKLDQDLLQAAGLPAPALQPLVHFGGRVDVMVGPCTPA
ncbi:MAG: DUF2071 domain-containing protein [Bryobacteraceae bacterium]